MVCVIILVTGVSISLPPNGSALGERLVDLPSHARTRLAARGGGRGALAGGSWCCCFREGRAALHVSYEGARHPRVRRGNSDGPVSAWILFGRCRTRHAHRADFHSKLRSCGVCLASRAGMLLLPCAARPGFSRPTMRLAQSRAGVDSNLTPPPPSLPVSLRHTTIAHPPRSQVQISCRHACSLHFASRIHGSSEAENPRTRSGDGLRIAQAGHPDNCTYPCLPGLSLAGQFPLQSKHC